MNVAKKELFLSSISKGDNIINKYKRVSLSPIRYAGGKSLAVGYIIEKLPDKVTSIVSPFFGGGSVEIAMNKYLDISIKGFDIFDILTNYWNFQINDKIKLYDELKSLSPDQETFNTVRTKLKNHWDKKKKLEPLDLAVCYFYNFSLSYGPGFMGWASKIYLNPVRYNYILKKVKDFSVNNFTVECSSFEDVMKKYKNKFLYLDPPYYIGEDSKMFKGIYPMRNIPIHHNGFKHDLLKDLLLSHKGGFILSYNNCETIRNWYKDFDQSFPVWQYTMGQGETRIGKNRIDNKTNHVKNSHEILICS